MSQQDRDKSQLDNECMTDEDIVIDVEPIQQEETQSVNEQAENKDDMADNKDDEQIDFDALLTKKKGTLFFKRIFDIVASFVGLTLLLVPLLIVAIAIKCSSKGPVFFRQERVGKDGKIFRIFKFRTMVVDAEQRGLQITVGEDNRVTRVGKFLRKTKLDELPQLINVLIGQMSFVGPRPDVPYYVNMYNEYERNVLKIKPGITALASIVYRDENEVLAQSDDPEKAYIYDIMPKKVKLNLEYMQKMSFWYDIKLIFMTIGIMFK